MNIKIPRDYFDNPRPPRLFLCDTGKLKIGELKAYNINLTAKWNSYSELSFKIDRYYLDTITGETKVDPLFDLTEGLRKVYLEGFGYFSIQDPTSEYSDAETKSLTAFSSEYDTSQKYLDNFFINTGEDDSAEVIYWAKKYGDNYYDYTDNRYTEIKEWIAEIAYVKVFIKEVDQDDSSEWNYSQIQIKDEADFNTKKAQYGNLYRIKYNNVQFYNPQNKELSLLHLVFEKIPEWRITFVDSALAKLECTFSETHIDIYSFIMTKMCDAFKCIAVWDIDNSQVRFYSELDDGMTEDSELDSVWDTDVYISRNNLANNINIKYSADNIKTKLKVSGGDDLDLREINLGRDYILNLNYYHTVDWMGQDLYDRWGEYEEELRVKEEIYSGYMTKWIRAYNKWDEKMYNIPTTSPILYIGDKFDYLYCVYASGPMSLTDKKNALAKQLNIYNVDADKEAKETDNVLLTLQSDDKISVTFRLFYDDDPLDKSYKVKGVFTNPNIQSGGTTSATWDYSLDDWINGEIKPASFPGDFWKKEYKVKSIGILGSYFCLMRDESNPDNLEDYGVELLKQREQEYSSVFIAQTEGYMSQNSASCTVSESAPTNPKIGDKWLDIQYATPVLWECIKTDTGLAWKEIDTTSQQIAAKNYARYIDNFTKLQNIKTKLVQRERQAMLYDEGCAVNNFYLKEITAVDTYSEGLPNKIITEFFDKNYGADKYTLQSSKYSRRSDFIIEFGVNFKSSNEDVNYCLFQINGTPYIAYHGSCASYQLLMDDIREKTEMSAFFTSEQLERLSPFIREDEFNENNIIITEYDSEEEKLIQRKELLKQAQKTLKTLSQPSLEFDMSLANLFAIPEFECIWDKFILGGYIRVEVREDYIKRARLLEINIDFDDVSNFSAKFGNLVTTKSEIDKHAELLKQAVNAGKTVASSANNWQKAVDKSNSIDRAIRNGLRDAALEIGSVHGQNITWDQYGIWGRKLKDGTDNEYEDEQFRLINNRLLFSDDGFRTTRSVFGKFSYDSDGDGTPEVHYGVLADSLIGGFIQGSKIEGAEIKGTKIEGGSLKIGGDNGNFEVREDGSVSITTGAGKQKYIDPESVKQYRVQIEQKGTSIFSTQTSSCELKAHVYTWDEELTDGEITSRGIKFNWIRNSTNADADNTWNGQHEGIGSTIEIKKKDLNGNAQFSVKITT